MIRNKFKKDDEYGDYLLEQKRDENINKSYENINKCPSCTGYACSDGKHFVNQSLAVDHQYNIERGRE